MGCPEGPAACTNIAMHRIYGLRWGLNQFFANNDNENLMSFFSLKSADSAHSEILDQNCELDLKRFLSFSTLHHKHVLKIVHYNHSSLHHDYFFFFMQAKKSFDDESKQGALKVAAAAAS